MKIYHAQVNHLENPVGFRMERMVFSWKIKEAKGKQQSYARIRVSSDEAMEHLLFDSGEDTKASSLCYPVKLELEPRTRYYWTVEAGSDAGEKAVSEVQFFETGKREEAWSAKWVSCSSIYRWLKKGLLEQSAALQVHLRHYKHQHGEKRGRFHGIRELNERSRQALWRKRVGDWEVDTIVSSNRKGCLLSVCDRKSRYCGLVLLRSCSAKEAMRGFRFLFEDGKLPLKTMTGDRGKEFACYQEVEKTLGVPFYFTRPHSPWQKPSVENLNGLVRQFFPRGTNFQEMSQQEVTQVMDMLNHRPRKCLRFASPAEVLHFT